MTFATSLRTVILAVPAVIGLMVAGATVADAKDSAAHSRSATKTPKIVGIGKGQCAAGFDTQNGILTPPDDSTADNVPAGSVTLTKRCNGPVFGRLTSEVLANAAGDFIHIDMRATCINNGGFVGGCAAGSVFFASPGHSFFMNNVQPGFEVNGIQMVWPSLLKGTWQFDALPGGNNHAFLDFRAFTVEAITQ